MRATKAEAPISKVLSFCVRNLQEAQTGGPKIRIFGPSVWTLMLLISF